MTEGQEMGEHLSYPSESAVVEGTMGTRHWSDAWKTHKQRDVGHVCEAEKGTRQTACPLGPPEGSSPADSLT